MLIKKAQPTRRLGLRFELDKRINLCYNVLVMKVREKPNTKINEAGQRLDRFTGKVLTCDLCGAEDSKENEVWEWGNPYDWGVICEECQCHET